MARLYTGRDLYKGYKPPKEASLNFGTDDGNPFQFHKLEDKTIDWVKATADHFEMIGWNNVRKNARRIYRNYQMRNGEFNKNDYIINPDSIQFGNEVGWMLPPQQESPLEQNYPLAPTFADALKGEYLKRDNRWSVQAIDPNSVTEAFAYKEEQFKEVVFQQAILEKQQALYRQGLTEESNFEAYQQQIQQTMQRLQEIELKAKNFRTTGAQWAAKVLKIQEQRYNLDELDPDGFDTMLTTDSCYFELDMLEDTFKLNLLNPMFCDQHKGPNVKYTSGGDYFLYFDFMSAGDVVNNLGRRMKEEDILKLQEIFVKTKNLIVVDQYKGRQGAYYDTSKPYKEAIELNPVLNDAKLGQELAYNYAQSGNFQHNMDIFAGEQYHNEKSGHPQMFRVMTLYWRAMRRIGWLTKINRDGTSPEPTWVDENFKVTQEPVYDNSVLKEKTKDNLIFGEHIDWTWATEWRHVKKIAANERHTIWHDHKTRFDAIYIDGGPVQFQFKGQDNPFDALPPVEGCQFTYKNARPNGLIDRLRGLAIVYNICMNKIPLKILQDRGLKVAIDKRSYSTNTPGKTAEGLSLREQYEESLDNSRIFEYTMSREAFEGAGQPALPVVLNLSTIQEAQLYAQMADQIKWMAGEAVGITRQRLGAQKASETATGINSGISYSETQTEYLYDQYAKLIKRVRQRMLDAAQYYSTFKESSRAVYMNDRDENVFLSIEGMENTLPHYNIHLQSSTSARAALQIISNFLMNENTLPIKPSAKLESLVEGSIPKILNLVKESELQQEQMQIQQQEQEMEMRRQELEAENARFAEEEHRKDQRLSSQLESNEYIASLKADVPVPQPQNDDAQWAKTGIDAALKQQDLIDRRKLERERMERENQQELNELAIRREEAQMKLEGDKYKADTQLKVAKENRVGEKNKKKK